MGGGHGSGGGGHGRICLGAESDTGRSGPPGLGPAGNASAGKADAPLPDAGTGGGALPLLAGGSGRAVRTQAGNPGRGSSGPGRGPNRFGPAPRPLGLPYASAPDLSGPVQPAPLPAGKFPGGGRFLHWIYPRRLRGHPGNPAGNPAVTAVEPVRQGSGLDGGGGGARLLPTNCCYWRCPGPTVRTAPPGRR